MPRQHQRNDVTPTADTDLGEICRNALGAEVRFVGQNQIPSVEAVLAAIGDVVAG
jgi:hypothetical protein